MASSRTPIRSPPSPESFESLSRRNAAAAILQSYEKLSWYSQQRCESLVQTRIHFQNIIAGISQEDEEACVYWKTDNSPHPDKAARDAEKRGSAKERVSEGTAGEGRTDLEDERRRSGAAGSSKKRKSSGRGA